MMLVEVHPFAWRGVGTTGDSITQMLDTMGYRAETVSGAPLAAISDYGHIVALRR